MTPSLSLLLKPGERIYLNGAVIRVDRKVRIEVLNDATFLLGQHIMQAENADTPLKQLYFAVQSMLIEPQAAAHAVPIACGMLQSLRLAFVNADVLAGLIEIDRDIETGRPYQALKKLRGLFALEAAILESGDAAREPMEMIA